MKATVLVAGALAVVVSIPAAGQSLQDRIDQVMKRRQAQAVAADRDDRHIRQRLSDVIDPVRIEQSRAKDVVAWWSRVTGIPVVINWEAMEQEGVDPEARINMDLRYVPAGVVLAATMQQMSPEVPLIYETTPWYLEVMTKQQANRRAVVRVYDIADLLMEVPQFNGAPRMDLQSALGNTSSGGGGTGGGRSAGGSTTSIFGDDSESDVEPRSREERAEQIAQLIRDTIEPDIWDTAGGQYASIRYYQGRLIISAPMYVHRQIGQPVPLRRKPLAAAPADPATPSTQVQKGMRTSGVAAVQEHDVGPHVSGQSAR